MKYFLVIVISLLSLANGTIHAQKADNPKVKWWQEDRFGMFIQFGIYSIHGRGEWVRSIEKISNEEYQPYVEEFNPIDYNPVEWAKLAKRAGMKYGVMTAKHHDGFCLFDSKLTDYKSTNTPIGRDLIKEYVEAFRSEGLKVGLYFSIIDWYHADYPKYEDSNHPMRGNEKFKDEKINWDRYLKFMHGQIKELLSNYGKIDILWLDFSYGEMRGEKWKAEELVKMIHKLQPDIIINNRLGGDGASTTHANNYGDFETPEKGVPDEPLLDENGKDLPWETCLTLNNSWGYNKQDNNWKSSELVIHTLVNCVGKGGNLLLNVGPDAKGNIPEASIQILEQVGVWMQRNSESIYGCTRTELFDKPDWGRITQKGNKLYFHVMHPMIGPIKLHGYQDKIEKTRFVADGSVAPIANSWWGSPASKGFVFINMRTPIHETFTPFDPVNTVIEITLK